jgi:catechol 2,3-dioxygenase-like lactoylglutathione lyase family enzyme
MHAVLDHIVLACRDVEAMLGFYVDLLGLAPHRVREWRRGELPFPCARVNADTLIDLMPPAMWASQGQAAGAAPNLHHFCLSVARADWERLGSVLAAAGIPATEPRQLSGARGTGTSVYVSDPDGNIVELRCYD